MPKSKRDVLRTLADKIGGEQGARMREQLGKKTPFDDILDRQISDEEYTSQLERLASLPALFLQLKSVEKPGTWGLSN